MFQGLMFGVTIVVAVGTALYWLVQNAGQEGPHANGMRYERPPPRPTLLEQKRKRRRQEKGEGKGRSSDHVKSTDQVNESDVDFCTICMDSLCDSKSSIRLLTCGHEFHNKCLIQWLVSNKTCPVCREEVNE